MSEKYEKSEDNENPFPNPMKIFGDLYKQTMKQTAEQWEDVARNPLFLAAMANNAEQMMQMQKQMQEIVKTSLQTLNLPTKDDFLLLVEKINQLNSHISEINAKLERIAEQNNSSSPKSQTKGGKSKP